MEIGVELSGLAKSFGPDAPAVRDVSLRVPAGRFVSLLGPSGCGKTTTLRMIAGLETPDHGEIRVLGQTVYSADQSINTQPHRRQIGFVFQSYALWPHMTVFDNLAYPLRRSGMAQVMIRDKVADTLKMLKAEGLHGRYPGELSGGQQQRVALGRAVINPANQVILFDEPLSNLDAKLREDLRMELRALQQDLGFTAIYVTHDQAEALAMSDEIVVMRDGLIERAGDPESVFQDPESRYVAEFFGAHNLLAARVVAAMNGETALETALGTLAARPVVGDGVQAGQMVTAALPIDAIEIALEPPPRPHFTAKVAGLAYYGSYTDVHLGLSTNETVRCRVPGRAGFGRGQTMHGRVVSAAVILRR